MVSGTSNPILADEIASYLDVENVPLVSKRFADGELYVQIQQSIRGYVFLFSQHVPVNDSLMELMIMVDACKRASARQITAVIPYFDMQEQIERLRESQLLQNLQQIWKIWS